jgi:hypothetical protein
MLFYHFLFSKIFNVAVTEDLEHWLETFQDRIWTDDLMAELSKAG